MHWQTGNQLGCICTERHAVMHYPREHTLAFEFWASLGNSRPTGNKSDTKRKRLGPNEYIENEKQILEITQSKIFQDFQKKYPEIGTKQRAFENCTPFFVMPTWPEDRNSCCCPQHVEIRMLFNTCMDYRRSIVSKDAERRYFKFTIV